MNDLAWLDAYATARFALDASGRLCASAHDDAPRFWLARSALANTWRMGALLSREEIADLARLAAREPVFESLRAEPMRLPRFAALAGVSGAEPRVEIEVLYACDPGLASAAPRSPRILRLEIAEAALFLERQAGTGPPLSGPCVAIADPAGKPLSVCVSRNRAGPETSRMCIPLLFTVPPARGEGLAAQLLDVWAREVTARGQLACYAAKRSDGSARAVARRHSLRCVGDAWSFT